MSRTKTRGKGPGFEYWGKRKNKRRYSVGHDSKKWTHRQERREARIPERKQDD